jgi:hypothetical protein
MADFLVSALLVAVASIAAYRWHSRLQRAGRAFLWIEARVPPGVANLLRIVLVVALPFSVIYFFASTVRMFIRVAKCSTCAPDAPMISRVLHCLL